MKGKDIAARSNGVIEPAREKLKTYPRVRLDQSTGGVAKIEAHSRSEMRELFGVTSDDVVDGLLRQVINIKSAKELSEHDANFALGVMRGIAPTDTVEALLAAQMVAIHVATMAEAERLSRAELVVHHDLHLAALTKLARTFTAQVEALKRYRSKGEQRVFVERVNVEAGAQAVVGDVTTGGRGRS